MRNVGSLRGRFRIPRSVRAQTALVLSFSSSSLWYTCFSIVLLSLSLSLCPKGIAVNELNARIVGLIVEACLQILQIIVQHPATTGNTRKVESELESRTCCNERLQFCLSFVFSGGTYISRSDERRSSYLEQSWTLRPLKWYRAARVVPARGVRFIKFANELYVVRT